MTSETFKQNWDWQLAYIEQVKQILKSQAMHIVNIEIASPEEDMKQSTDLKIKITAGDVAVRIRRDNIKYRDLTIRAKNGNSRTEIHKLRDGFGDWYLYAWTIGGKITEWILVDIGIMRLNDLFAETRPITMNKDGYTGFVTYPIQELQRYGAVVASKRLAKNP
ncbi:MAG: hypothetical protein QM315_05905 [Bacillota bacterium]|nr:hypothetical protein [Bacillota bacterium]